MGSDRAATKAGEKTGVAIRKLKPSTENAYGHGSNLGVADAIQFNASVTHLTQYAKLESWLKRYCKETQS